MVHGARLTVPWMPSMVSEWCTGTQIEFLALLKLLKARAGARKTHFQVGSLSDLRQNTTHIPFLHSCRTFPHVLASSLTA